MTFTRATIILGLLAIAAPAYAETQADRDACRPDVFRLCMSEVPNVDRIVACLNRNTDQLNPTCRKVMSGGSAEARASRPRRTTNAD